MFNVNLRRIIQTTGRILCAGAMLLAVCAPPASAADKAVSLSLDSAVLKVLENNSAFKIQRLNIDLSKLSELQQRAVFGSTISNDISTTAHSAAGKSDSTQDAFSLTKTFESGLELKAGAALGYNSGSAEDYSSRFSAGITKPLLRDSGREVNLASLRKAELSTLSSRYQLQAYAETLVAQTVSAYWDYELAAEQLTITEESLKIAEEQLRETQTLIEVGKIAGIELVAAKAELASRNEALINARSKLDTLRLSLLRLTSASAASMDWNAQIATTEAFLSPAYVLPDVEECVAVALKNRPDLNEAKILLDQNSLDLVKTKNGLLPYLGFYVTLGSTTYADTFGGSLLETGGDDNDLQLGISYKSSIGRRSEKATHKQTLITREQKTESLNNLEMLAQEDVRGAWIEIRRAEQQITATAATRTLQQEKASAEVEKQRVGKSTALNVAQAQRDLLNSRLAEKSAVAAYLKAVTELLRLEGTLLKSRGIVLSE